jgi:hypothetical protein
MMGGTHGPKSQRALLRMHRKGVMTISLRIPSDDQQPLPTLHKASRQLSGDLTPQPSDMHTFFPRSKKHALDVHNIGQPGCRLPIGVGGNKPRSATTRNRKD